MTNRREQNRRAMPNVAAVVDQFNEFFGPVKVHYAEDKVTGKTVGIDEPAEQLLKRLQGR